MFRSTSRGQTLAEFALVAPLLFLVVFAMVDFGRAIYCYVTLQQAANEGARVAVQGQPPFFGEPTNDEVESSVAAHATGMVLANPCPNGPVNGVVPPPNQGYVFITQPDVSTSPSPTNPNATGPTTGTAPPGCWTYYPASGHQPLRVTVVYNFTPITPGLNLLLANRIILSSYAIYQTEY